METMDLAPFLASLEKLGMFGIAGYLVWHLVKNSESLVRSVKETSEQTLVVLHGIDNKLTRIASDLEKSMEKNEHERAELLRALANVRGGQRGSINLSLLLGMVLALSLLGWYANVLKLERDAAAKARDDYSAQVEASKTREAELQAAIASGEIRMREYAAMHEKAVKEISHAKPNDCTDAPVAPDIDRILREQTGASLGYLPDTGKRPDTARTPEVARRHKPRTRGVLLEEPPRCVGV